MQALQVITRILQAFPGTTYTTDTPQSLTEGAVVPIGTPIGDTAIIATGHGKGQPQAARKQYFLAPRAKLDKVVWSEFPRAARLIAELLPTTADQALTSHEIMERLKIARPTVQNAMSKLLRGKIAIAIPVRDGRSVARNSAEHR